MKSFFFVSSLLAAATAAGERKQIFDPAPFVNLTVVLMVVALVAMVLFIPRIYRWMLDKEGGDKNLNKFLLNDPATRDLLMKKKIASARSSALAPTAKAPAKTAAPVAPPASAAPTPAAPQVSPPAVKPAAPERPAVQSADSFFVDPADAPPTTPPPKK